MLYLSQHFLAKDVIAPSHGVIWRQNPMQIVEKDGKVQALQFFNLLGYKPAKRRQDIGVILDGNKFRYLTAAAFC